MPNKRTFFAQVLSGEVENVWDVNDSLENMRLLDGAMQSQDKKRKSGASLIC